VPLAVLVYKGEKANLGLNEYVRGSWKGGYLMAWRRSKGRFELSDTKSTPRIAGKDIVNLIWFLLSAKLFSENRT